MTLQTRIPPPVYAFLTAVLIWAVDRNGWVPRPIGPLWVAVGWILVAAGVGLDLYAIGSFVRIRTTVNPIHPGRASRLVVSGVYRISRNPMYLGLALSLSGWTLLVASPIELLLVWVFIRLIEIMQIAPEEAALRERFGDFYGAYSGRVNRWVGRRRVPNSALVNESDDVR